MNETKSKILTIKNKDFKKEIKDILRKDQKNQLDLHNTVFKIIQKILTMKQIVCAKIYV